MYFPKTFRAGFVAAGLAIWGAGPAIAEDAFRVVDGDTVARIEPGGAEERIRLANIDAPEIFHVSCPAEREAGLLAAARLVAILQAGDVEIRRGDGGRDRDRYGRTLARLFVDGVDVGELLIAEGLARPWRGRRESWC